MDSLNNDGITLLMAYALNIDPNAADRNKLPGANIDNNSFYISYFEGRSDISYSPKVSTNRSSWTTDGIIKSTPNSEGYVTASISRNGKAKMFIQIDISN